MRLARARRSRGNALTEYVILLVAIVTLGATVVMEYGRSLQAEFSRADSSSVWDEVTSGLDSGPGADDADCPYYYNNATGRWHDSDSHLFVSFSDAEGAGC